MSDNKKQIGARSAYDGNGETIQSSMSLEDASDVYTRMKSYYSVYKWAYSVPINARTYFFINGAGYVELCWMPTLEYGYRRLTFEEFLQAWKIKY